MLFDFKNYTPQNNFIKTQLQKCLKYIISNKEDILRNSDGTYFVCNIPNLNEIDLDFKMDLNIDIVVQGTFFIGVNTVKHEPFGGGDFTNIIYKLDDETKNYFKELFNPVINCYGSEQYLENNTCAEKIKTFVDQHKNDESFPCISIIISKTDDYDHIEGFDNYTDEKRETIVDVVKLSWNDVRNLQNTTNFGRRKRIISKEKFVKLYMKFGNSKSKALKKYMKACNFFM